MATNAKKTPKSKAKTPQELVPAAGDAVAHDSYAAAEAVDVDSIETASEVLADAPAQDVVADIAQDGISEVAQDNMPADAVVEAAPTPAPAKSGLGGMVFGGVIAATLGFGVAQYANDGWPFGAGYVSDPAIAQNSAQLAALSQKLDSVAADAVQSSDLDSLRSELGPVRAGIDGLSARISDTAQALAAVTARVDQLEKQPLQQGASEAAIAAYERELEKLQAAMAAQRAEVEAMTSSAQELEANAEEIARQTMARAAVTRVLTTLDVGGSFAEPLAELKNAGVDVPADLTTASGGVATRDALRDAFPDASRAALRAVRDANVEGGATGGGLGAFLRDQLGARSVTPREGDDPDAILSRAEEAVRQGRLGDALAEIDTLPDVAKAELATWVAQANERGNAVNAAEALAQSLSQQ